LKPRFRPGGQAGEQREEVDVAADDGGAPVLRGILIFVMLLGVVLVGSGVKSFMDTRQFQLERVIGQDDVLDSRELLCLRLR